jgi:GTP-binding protein Era
MHKAGFVNIIGNPNVGKSTLMNELVGEKLSIITSKSQTTRHRIKGIVNTDDYQIVFSDTPGILEPKYKLQKSMMDFVHTALKDADLLLYITDVYESFDKHRAFLEKIKNSGIPIVLIINKIDLCDQRTAQEKYDLWSMELPDSKIFLISALNKFNTEHILDAIQEYLPDSPPFFDKDTLTDRPMRFFISEMIREKILLNYDKEIPYNVEVVVDAYKEEEDIVRISALLYVSKDSQKNIIIGPKGSAIKRLGISARKDIEAFVGKKVFLKTFIKVKKDWRDKDNILKGFGYEQG